MSTIGKVIESCMVHEGVKGADYLIIIGNFPVMSSVTIIESVTCNGVEWYKIRYPHTTTKIDYGTIIDSAMRVDVYDSIANPKVIGYATAGNRVNNCKIESNYVHGTFQSNPPVTGYVKENFVNIKYKTSDYGYVQKSHVVIVDDEITSTTPGTINADNLKCISPDDQEIHQFHKGDKVNIISVEGDNYIVEFEGKKYTILAKYISVDKTDTQATVNSNDTTTLQGSSNAYGTPTSDDYQEYTTASSYQSMGYTDTNPNWVEKFAEFNAIQGQVNIDANVYDDEYYKKLGFKYFNALGYPPKYNMDIDLQYPGAESDGSPGQELFLTGRVMSKTFLSNPPILSICPGKVRMFPNLFGTERDNFMEAMAGAAAGNGELINKIMSDNSSLFSGKLYHFEADTANYAFYVNALCRACAILLGIGNEVAPWTGAKLATFDYSYWALRNQYNEAAAAQADPDASMFRNFWDNLVSTASRMYTSLVEDTTYINFFLNGTETQVSESIQTGVSDGPLSNLFNSVNELANTINYFTGSGFNFGAEGNAVTEAIRNALDTGNSTLDGIIDLGKNFMQGGKVVLPKMLSGAEYGKSISCSAKFVSPYGDPYSVFLRCIVPVCHLLALALPRQLSDNMYTYPFLIKANQLGQFHVDLGVISNISISRGGAEDTCWTVDGLATEWDVQFEITPLVDELMMTGTNHPVLFCKNENLIDYLGNFCGFDLLANNFSTQIEVTNAFIGVGKAWHGYFKNLENRATDWLFNALAKYSKVSWG